MVITWSHLLGESLNFARIGVKIRFSLNLFTSTRSTNSYQNMIDVSFFKKILISLDMNALLRSLMIRRGLL